MKFVIIVIISVLKNKIKGVFNILLVKKIKILKFKGDYA